MENKTFLFYEGGARSSKSKGAVPTFHSKAWTGRSHCLGKVGGPDHVSSFRTAGGCSEQNEDKEEGKVLIMKDLSSVRLARSDYSTHVLLMNPYMPSEGTQFFYVCDGGAL